MILNPRYARHCVILFVAWPTAAWLLGNQLLAQTDKRITVRIDGRAVLRLGSSGPTDAAERIERIERRIAALLERPQAIKTPRIESTGPQERTISVSGAALLTVTPADAEDNLTTVDQLAKEWAEALDRALTRAAARRISPWDRFASEVQASIEAAFGRLGDSAVKIVPRALAALLVVLLFWSLAVAIRWLMRLAFHRFIEDRTVENLLKQVAFYTVLVLGFVVAVDAFGMRPQTVITGLGLTGLALGFALKDVLSNFVSGIMILTFRSFRLGDQIVIGDTEGNVERIELRATQIRTYDGRAVLVPNAELLTSRIVNNTWAPVRRASVEIMLGYDIDLRQARQAMLAAMRSVSSVLPDPEPTVRIRDLCTEGIRFESRFWTDSRRSDFLATRSEVAEAMVAHLQQYEVPLPQPAERLVAPDKLEKWRAFQQALGLPTTKAAGRSPHNDAAG